jgi:signal peptidase II
MGFWGWIVVSLIILISDQFSKIAIVQKLELGQDMPIFDFFNITLVYNKGAAFSFLANQDGWQRWFFTMISVLSGLIITWLLQKSHKQTMFSCGLSLILGGAIGNLIDRLWHGHVVDFLDFYVQDFHWPAFNVADIAICIGVSLLIIDEISRVRKADKSK